MLGGIGQVLGMVSSAVSLVKEVSSLAQSSQEVASPPSEEQTLAKSMDLTNIEFDKLKSVLSTLAESGQLSQDELSQFEHLMGGALKEAGHDFEQSIDSLGFAKQLIDSGELSDKQNQAMSSVLNKLQSLNALSGASLPRAV